MSREKSRQEERFFASSPVFRKKKRTAPVDKEKSFAEKLQMINGLLPAPASYTYTYTGPNTVTYTSPNTINPYISPYTMAPITFSVDGMTMSVAQKSVAQIRQIDSETVDLARQQQQMMRTMLSETHAQIIGLLTAATGSLLRAMQSNTNVPPEVIDRLKRMVIALDNLRFDSAPQIEEAIKHILEDGGENEEGSREQIKANIIGIESAMRPLLLQLALSGGRAEREW